VPTRLVGEAVERPSERLERLRERPIEQAPACPGDHWKDERGKAYETGTGLETTTSAAGAAEHAFLPVARAGRPRSAGARVLAGTARATPFAAGAFPRMKQANAKIETLAKHFLTVSFGTCQHNRSTMPNCVDAAAQPLFKAFPGVHNVLVTYLGEREHLAVPLDHAEHNRLVGGGPT
jgi:hypothetical protein